MRFGRYRACEIFGRRSRLLTVLAAMAALVGFAAPGRAQGPFGEPKVVVSAVPMRTAVAPGDTLAVAVIFDHAPKWHIHTAKPVLPASWAQTGFEPIPTVIAATPSAGLSVLTVQYPAEHTVKVDLLGTGTPEPYAVYEGRAVAYVPVRVLPEAAGPQALTLSVSYQVCDDATCLPQEEIELKVEFEVRAGAAASVSDAALFEGFDPSIFAKAAAGGAGAAAQPTDGAGAVFDFFGLARFNSGNAAVVLMFSALGGFILNLMPCVLPLIPIKVFALQQAAGENTSKRLMLGVAMALGVVAFWATLALLIVSFKVFSATSELFGNPWFQLGVGVFIVAMAVGMMGLFTISLPQSMYAINPRHDTLHGSFLFGVMTALFGTPCFGPFAASGLSWATQQSSAFAFTVFVAVGVGMALPYLALTFWPKLLSFLPRTGPASDLVKQVMALIMGAFGVYFCAVAVKTFIAEYPYLGMSIEWWFVAIICTATALWLMYRTFKITQSWPRRVVFTLIGVALAWGSIRWADRLTEVAKVNFASSHRGSVKGATTDSLWGEYTPERFDAAVAAGHTVVLDFTASWCINCQVMKATILNREDVRTALQQPGVVAMEVDLTSGKAIGWAKLHELKEPGIPLLAIFGPGYEKPWKSNAYNAKQVIEAVSAATAKTPRVGTGGTVRGAPEDSRVWVRDADRRRTDNTHRTPD